MRVKGVALTSHAGEPHNGRLLPGFLYAAYPEWSFNHVSIITIYEE